MGQFDNKLIGISHDMCIFSEEIMCGFLRDGLVRAQPWPVIQAQAATLWLSSSRVIAEMLKAAGEEGVELARQQTEAVFCCGVIPADREERFILNLYIRARVKPMTMATMVVSSSQIKSWSCWNGYYISTSVRSWTSTRYNFNVFAW